MSPDQIRTHINNLIKQKGKNYRSLSLAMGKNEAYLHQYINKGSPSRLPEEQRRILARILDVDEQELTDIRLPKTVLQTVGPTRTALIEMLSSDEQANTDHLASNTSGFFSIPLSDFSNITSSPADMIKMVRITGDSMSPTLKDGDYILADFSQPKFSTDGLYLISSANHLLVKRLQQISASELMFISDNTNYKSISMNIKKVNIVGKVIFIFRTEKIA